MTVYLHLGMDTVIRSATVVGICDLDTATVAKPTRDFLAAAEKQGRVVTVTTDLPKSFVVCAEKDGIRVYLSQLSVSTLLRRTELMEY